MKTSVPTKHLEEEAGWNKESLRRIIKVIVYVVLQNGKNTYYVTISCIS